MKHSFPGLISIPLAFAAITGLAGCSAPLTGPTATAIDLPLVEPPSGTPLTAIVWITPPVAKAGDLVQFRVTVRLAAGYYVYGVGAPAEFTPIAVALSPSEKFVAAGPWVGEDATAKGHLTGTLHFRRQLQIASDAKGECPVSCDLTYQACNSELCWPAVTQKLHASLRLRE